MERYVNPSRFENGYRKSGKPFSLCLKFERSVITPEQELERLRRELAEAEKKVSQYRNQEKTILNKARDRERRNRTRRLIEHGAILENVFPVRDMDAGELTALLTEISLLPVVSEMLEAYKKDGRRRT